MSSSPLFISLLLSGRLRTQTLIFSSPVLEPPLVFDFADDAAEPPIHVYKNTVSSLQYLDNSSTIKFLSSGTDISYL